MGFFFVIFKKNIILKEEEARVAREEEINKNTNIYTFFEFITWKPWSMDGERVFERRRAAFTVG